MRWLLTLWLFLGLQAWGIPVHAQDTSSDEELAKQEYELGFKDLEKQRYRQALVHYQLSYEHTARPRTTYNIALCLEALGDYQEAMVQFQKFLHEAEARDADFLVAAREKLSVLHAKVGGTIRVRSDPSGASVNVDGEIKGHTPLRLDLLAGNHLISVGRKSTRLSERNIEVRIGDDRTEDFQLDLIGHVHLNVSPSDALIRRKDVDDVSTGSYDADLSPGTYEFELSLLGYETRSITLDVKASDNINQSIRMRGHSSTGALRVQSDQHGAQVSVDGLIIGSTKKGRGDRPEIERRLSAGNHVIIVEGSDGASWSERVHVSPGETLLVDLKFRGGAKRRKYARWGLTAIGVTAIASGLTLGVLALSDVREDNQEAHDRGFGRASTTDILLGVGALSLGGAYLLGGQEAEATVERTHEEAEETVARALRSSPEKHAPTQMLFVQ